MTEHQQLRYRRSAVAGEPWHALDASFGEGSPVARRLAA